MNPLEIPAEKRARVSRLDRATAPLRRAIRGSGDGLDALARIGTSTTFCVVFGLITPLLCLWFDPLFFRRGGTTPFTSIAPFGYVFIASQLVALALWLRKRPSSAWFGGFLAAGAVFALLVSFPAVFASMFALAELLSAPRTYPWHFLAIAWSVLGLTPPLTFAVYAYAAKRATRSTNASAVGWLAFSLAFVAPIAVQIAIARELRAARKQFYVAESVDAEQHAVARLRRFRLVYSPNALIAEWRETGVPTRKQRIERLYEALTGHPMPKDDSFG
ncbi:MAG: hypothetical protein ACKVWV_11690 [Planctomycetota bacterium]